MKVRNLTKYILPASLSLAVFFLPFSLIFCHLGLAVYCIACVAEGQWNQKLVSLRQNSVIIFYIFFFLLHVVAIIYSDDKSNGWFNIEKKISLILIPLAFASRTPMSDSELRWLLNSFILSCFIATIICLGNAADRFSGSLETFSLHSLTSNDFYMRNANAENPWLFFSYDQLASGIDIHPTYLSLYLAFCAVVLIDFHARSFRHYALGKKFFLFVLFVYFGLIIILLSSRIITLAFLGITFWGTYVLTKTLEPNALRWIFSLTVIGLLCCLIYLFPITRYRIIEEIGATPVSFYKPGLQTQSTGIRASLWWIGIRSVRNVNPIWGAGPGDVQSVMKATSDKNQIQNVLGTNDPHNQYLQTLLGLGIVGLMSLFLCFALPFVTAWRQRDYLYLGFISLFAWTCMVESVLELQKGIVFFALFNSLLVFQRNTSHLGRVHMTHLG